MNVYMSALFRKTSDKMDICDNIFYLYYLIYIKYACKIFYVFILLNICILYKRLIRIAHRLWSNYSNNGCLLMESLRIQWLFRLKGCISLLVSATVKASWQRARVILYQVFYIGCYHVIYPQLPWVLLLQRI